MNLLDIARRLLRAKINTYDAERIKSADIRRLFLQNALIASYHPEASYIANETLKNFAKAREQGKI